MSLTRQPDALTLLWLLACFTCLAARVEAAISVGPLPGGSGTNTFDATPAATDWSTTTSNALGVASDITTTAAMDADVNAKMDAANITTVLPTSSTQPISTSNLARRNTASNYLATLPSSSGSKYVVLMATLQNNSGTDLIGVDVSYDLGTNLASGVTGVEEIPGHRVYYSLTGATGSWAVVEALSGGTAGLVSGTVPLGAWATNALLYLLWVDDNGSINPEPAYTIDNWVAFPTRPKDLSFQEGVNGYAGTQDTQIRGATPDRDDGALASLSADSADGSGQNQVLIRFDNIFGTGLHQIPPGATILDAALTMTINDPGSDPSMHQMLVPWTESTTWNTIDPVNLDGVTADDVEAAAVADVTFPGTPIGTIVIPLPKSTLQAWLDGSTTNYGWVLLPSGTDGTDSRSSEYSVLAERPRLTVTWATLDLPFVKSVSPLNGATDVPLDANIVLTIVDGATKLNTNSIQLLVNNQNVVPVLDQAAVPNETTLTYDPPANFPPTNIVTLRVVFSDDAIPPNLSTKDFSFTTRPVTLRLFAIDDVQAWKYDRSGTDLGTAWRERNYDDSAWPEGMALIGQDTSNVDQPIRTTIDRFNDLGEYIQTFYFRTHFNYAGPLGGDLRLRHVIDDGAVFYLNGTEIHRFGIAAGATFNYLTSFTGHENAYEGIFVIPDNTLLNGTNVFAAEVHQSGTSSSDFVFGAELEVAISALRPTIIGSRLPAPDSTEVSPGATIEITLADGAQQVQTNSIQLFLNCQAVTPQIVKLDGGRHTKITHSPPGGFPLESLVAVRLVFSDDATPPNITTNTYSFTTRPDFTVLFAIDDFHLWSYENSGANLGTAWKEKLFDDSAWPQGSALLAAETGVVVEPIRTTLFRLGADGTNIITDYFRTHFNFTNNPAGARLRIRQVVDDGMVLYLNGAEVHRFGLAPGVTFDNLTPFADHEGRNQYDGPFLIPAASLVQGDNVLAAEVHQTGLTSSDVVFGLELQWVTSDPPAVPLFTSVARSGPNIVMEWTGRGTIESASAVTGPWTVEANACSPFSAATSGTAKFYRLRP